MRAISRECIGRWHGTVIILGGHALLLGLAYSPWSWAVRSYAKRVADPQPSLIE
jgi:hypothetical protein